MEEFEGLRRMEEVGSWRRKGAWELEKDGGV